MTLTAGLLVAGCTAERPPSLRAADPDAIRGGVLRVATTAPGSVDPGNVYEPVGDLVVRTLCTPLLTTDPASSELLPGIVSSWIVTDDGAGLVLRLRDDVVFSDGTPLTAADVAFSLSRIASADFASTSAERLEPVLGYGELHGDIETDDALDRQRLKGVEARDDRNVSISLGRRQGDFVRLLASPLTAPVSKAAAQRDPQGFGRQPVCVGPYALSKPYVPGDDGLRLVRSRSYEPVEAALTAGGAGYADAIEFTFYEDDAAAAQAVTNGDADLAPARPSDVDRVQSGPGPMVEHVGLPAATDGFDSAAVRRALALAIDREELVRRVFPGTRRAADGFLPDTAPLDDSCAALPSGGDAAAARAELARAGVDLRGVRVPFYVDDGLRNPALAAEVARQWREVLGLVAVPMPMTFREFLDRGTGAQGFDGFFRFSWSVPYPDVDGYLHPLFATSGIGRNNLSRFSDPVLDRVLDRVAREAVDPADRGLGYTRATELLCEQMPMVPVTTTLSRWLVGDRVGAAGGRFVDGSTGQPMLRELHLRSS